MDYQRTRKCNKCGSDIPVDAVYCDVCGEPVSRRVAKKQEKAKARPARNTAAKQKTFKDYMAMLGIGVVVAVAVIFVIGLIVGAISEYEYKQYQKRIDLSDWEETVTPEEFEKIQIGMTYEEVKEAVGGDGKLIEDEKYWIEYRWPGEYYVDKYEGYVEVQFDTHTYGDLEGTPPTVESIVENEVVHGKETFETRNLINERNYSALETEYVTRTQLSKIEAGMTYEEVCEVLESEGKCYRSRCYKRESRTDTTEEYVWKCKNSGYDDYFSQTFEDGVVKELPTWKLDFID